MGLSGNGRGPVPRETRALRGDGRYDWNAVMRIEISTPGMIAPSLAT